MSTYNFLDKTGLGQVWGKIKALIPTKTSDLTNDSGFVTTDEKLALQDINTASVYYPILTLGTGIEVAKKQFVDTSGISYGGGNGVSSLTLGASGESLGRITIYGSGQYYCRFLTKTLSDNRILRLPDATGTVALTSDIPSVPTKTSDLTNDSGFLTLSTLPIYDGSVSSGDA